jgi:hypothetical protein
MATGKGARVTGTPLATTLVALVESLQAPAGSGLVVERASLDVPLEGRVDATLDGPVFYATLPHTRWRSGLLPAVHLAHLDVGLPEGEGEG